MRPLHLVPFLLSPLTVKPAAAIANAAQKWGQDDDINVLTVARLATATA